MSRLQRYRRQLATLVLTFAAAGPLVAAESVNALLVGDDGRVVMVVADDSPRLTRVLEVSGEGVGVLFVIDGFTANSIEHGLGSDGGGTSRYLLRGASGNRDDGCYQARVYEQTEKGAVLAWSSESLGLNDIEWVLFDPAARYWAAVRRLERFRVQLSAGSTEGKLPMLTVDLAAPPLSGEGARFLESESIDVAFLNVSPTFCRVALLFNGSTSVVASGPEPMELTARPTTSGGTGLVWDAQESRLWVRGQQTWSAFRLIPGERSATVREPDFELNFYETGWFPTRLTPRADGKVVLTQAGATSRVEVARVEEGKLVPVRTVELSRSRLVAVSPSGTRVAALPSSSLRGVESASDVQVVTLD